MLERVGATTTSFFAKRIAFSEPIEQEGTSDKSAPDSTSEPKNSPQNSEKWQPAIDIALNFQ